MMGNIAGTATTGVSGAAAEAASGSMSMGNIRMSNINMNKYDAAQTMNAGTSTKMSMDYQQTASNQNSVSTGTRNIHDDADSIKHEGTTFMRNQDGELLRMTGNYEQTAGGWKFNGNVQNLSTGETYTGNMSGMAKNMNSMQQGLNIDDISMTGKERANLGDVKGENVAFIQGTVVDSNLSASDVTHKDKITTSNNIAQNNNIKEAKTVEDYSKWKDTRDVTKNNTMKENKHVEDNTTSISTGTHYKGVAQAAMGKTEDFEKMMNRLADMKQAVLNGDMSAKEFQAEVRNFSGAYAQEMGQFLTKQESEQQGTKAQANVGVQGDVSWDSGQTAYGKAAQAVTGLSASGGVGVDAGVGINRQDTTQSAQNLIAKEMYDTIMQSGNSTDMINNASNLANKHADTNLSDLENMKESFNEMTDKAKEMGAGAVESGKNMVKDIIK